ncbi:Fanconi anemia group M protein [Leptopilina boulardi]|uniref:Fanconi anemia group M protein n=1 Tax=Leptopilina boulardi TaxID=63433 RepID=UPI0021F51BEF|nr:Fanconi anemia group M protein [Leptopilina boulardi]XP_051163498.1 Fanconi anemia group M protein [Leptopilina boulardi]
MDDISSQHPLFSDDPGTLGFDLSAGNVWIYPENYPIREYQFTIVKKALFQNTLVCLPTGLGKTFIAAVLMYNFWRWYPKGKVVFLAPTKPLVAQQINACHEIMGIPSEETIELTGNTSQKLREIAWSKKRVIFATPQTFHKDLEKNIFSLNLVKCLVIDEAHKALGKHSYCESVRLLSEQNKFFRVLALSATPGDKITKVVEVITNLHISNLELRDDMSSDIIPYINERKLEIILVRLSDELARFKERYISVMDPHVRYLVRCNILKGDTGNISKGRIFHLVKEFQSRQNKSGNYGQIMKTLNILLTMSHAYELMIRHGLRAFLHFYENHNDKSWLGQEVSLHQMLEDIKNYLGPFPIIEPLSDGTIPDIPNDLLFGHNKFYKLKEVLQKHFDLFQKKNQETRAIVFVEYRDIVNEVYVLLLQSRPLIRPQMFVGQAGQKRKQQIEALENFRSNKVNVLISTSVGEEGLDVGEVDLIVCFDISQSSPIRLVQRMGRTGRKRDGHIIALVTDGKEHESLRATMSKKDSLNNKVLQSSAINTALYEETPRMIPNNLNPECRKMHMKVLTKTPKVKGAVKKKENPRIKKKNNESRLIEKEPGAKNVGQSSIQNFFRTIKPGEKIANYSNYGCSQLQQDINIKDVNLYFSDKESEEFLTLCTMRKTRNDFHILNFQINERYVQLNTYPNDLNTLTDDLNFLRNLVIPNLNDKDYVKLIPEIIENTEETINHDFLNSRSQIYEQDFPSSCFNNNEINFSNTFFETSEVTIHGSFVDLLYDTSSSSEEDNNYLPNQLEVTNNFDDLLLQTTDESEMEVEMEMQMENIKMEIKTETDDQNFCNEISSIGNNQENKETIFNFTDVLEDSSLDSVGNEGNEAIVNENSKNVITENRESEFNFSNLLGGTTLDSINSQDLMKSQNAKFSHEISSIKNSTPNIKGKNLVENEFANQLLGGTTLDCINSQDLLNSMISNNEENNSLRQENITQNNSIITLSTNSTGITVTQAVEEIGKINGDKSFNNYYSLFREKSTPLSGIVKNNPLTLEKSNSNNKEIVILDSDEELFVNNDDDDDDDISIISASSKKQIDGNIYKNIVQETTLTVGNLEITKLNPNKLGTFGNLKKFSLNENSSTTITTEENKSINEKENKNINEGRKLTIGNLEISTCNSNERGNFKKFSLNESENSKTNISEGKKLTIGNLEITTMNPSKSILNERGNFKKFSLNESNISTERKLTIGNLEITTMNSNLKKFSLNENSKSTNEGENKKKSLTINEKENSITIIDDDIWDSDFEIPTTDVNNTNYFKPTEIPKSTLTITKLTQETNNTENISETRKKFSLFKRDKPFSLIQDDNNQQTTNNNNSSKNNVEIFKKPNLQINLLKRHLNSPSTSNDKVNRNNNDASTSIMDKRKINRKINFNSTLNNESPERKRRKIKKRRRNCEFIDNEADVSSDEIATSEGSSGDDEDLEDFVSYTQINNEQVDMRAHYLNSVKSPIRRPGAFLIKKSSHFHENVYSQPASQYDDTYLQDSFCVNEDEVEYNDETSDDDLEVTFENLTEATQNRSKRKREKSPVFKSNKRKKRKGRIQNMVNSSSSDDETEQMRKQIQNDSILLKKL